MFDTDNNPVLLPPPVEGCGDGAWGAFYCALRTIESHPDTVVTVGPMGVRFKLGVLEVTLFEFTVHWRERYGERHSMKHPSVMFPYFSDYLWEHCSPYRTVNQPGRITAPW